jgi:hypothetical protein
VNDVIDIYLVIFEDTFGSAGYLGAIT